MQSLSSNSAPFAPRAIYSDVYPLEEFYAGRGQPLPAIGRIEAAELPDPYRELLAHEGDMTSRLESFHRSKIHIRLMTRRLVENEYFREVALCLARSEKPVEYGAIKMTMGLFPFEAQQEILAERRPLGAILRSFHVAFESRPAGFLRLEADDFIRRALNLTETHFLYGRRNTLTDPWGRPLAEIVEILPPTAPKRRARAVRAPRSSSLPS